MRNGIILCIHCDDEMTEYYDKVYKEIRRKYLFCEIDFPLER